MPLTNRISSTVRACAIQNRSLRLPSRRFPTEVRWTSGIADATAVGRTAPLDEPIILPDGRQYRGQFDRYGAVGTGSGTLVFPGGTYEGGFRGWARHGKGRTQYNDGKVEVGTYDTNCLVQGVTTFVAGDSGEVVMAGTWQNGHLVKGTLKRGTTLYTGEFSSSAPSGQGETTFPDGTRHIGAYSNGVFHGNGSLITPKGDVYTGVFEEGKLAEGSLQYIDGSRYEGQFDASGQLHGEGTFTDAGTGHVYAGHWAHGAFKSGQVLDQDGYPAELVTHGIRISDLRQQ